MFCEREVHDSCLKSYGVFYFSKLWCPFLCVLQTLLCILALYDFAVEVQKCTWM